MGGDDDGADEAGAGGGFLVGVLVGVLVAVLVCALTGAVGDAKCSGSAVGVQWVLPGAIWGPYSTEFVHMTDISDRPRC